MLEHRDEQLLLAKIEDERVQIESYLRRARPRHARLTVITLVTTALAAALTAGPALGGQDFTTWAARTFGLASSSAVWQPLCLAAMLVSITAAICVNLNQASKADSKIVSAEVCNTELACLQTLVEFHQVSLDEALKLYQQHLTRVPFLDHQKPPAPTPNWG
jgi:flavin-binding protein dodecin